MSNIYQNQKKHFQVESSWGAASVRQCAGFPSSCRGKTHPLGSPCYEAPLGLSIVVWDLEKRERKTFFQAHNDLITVMLYNLEFDITITASYSGEIKLWDSQWNVLHCLDTGFGKLQDGKWSTNGKRLVMSSIGEDSTLVVYLLKCENNCGTISASLECLWKTQASIHCIALTEDASTEVKPLPKSSTFMHYNDAFDGALFNPSGKLLVFLSKKDSSSDLILFSSDGIREKQTVLEPLGEKASSIMCVSECKFGVFAVGFQGGIFVLIDCNTMDSLSVFQATGSPQVVVWDNDKLLAFSYLSGVVSWWNIHGELLHELRGGPTDSIIHLNWDIPGKALWVGGIMSLHHVEFEHESHNNSQSSGADSELEKNNETSELHKDETNSEMGHLSAHPKSIRIKHSLKFHEVTGCGVDFTPTGLLVSGDFTGKICTWDRGKIHPSHSLTVHSSVRCISCRDDEIFIGTLDGQILKWSPSTEGGVAEECLFLPGGVLNMKWSQNWMQLVIGLTTGYLMVFGYGTAQEFQSELSVLAHSSDIEGMQTMEVWSVCWSPCQRMIATASEDHTVCIWNLQGSKLSTLRGHTTAVTSVDWTITSSGHNILASCADDRTVRVYNGENFSLVHTLNSKDIHGWHTLTYLSLNPGNNQCLCSTQNGHLILWDIISGERLACYKVHCGSIEGLVWKDNLIGTVSSDCVVNVFSVNEIA